MSKPAYQYDRSGYLVGITEADESPLEPGVYLVPSGCTLSVPPEELPDDKWPRWNGSTWMLASRPQQPSANDNNPVEKLRAFLSENPDVAELIATNQGGV